MADREMIIKGCENWVKNHKDESLLLAYSAVEDLLAVLKEQDAVKPIKENDGKKEPWTTWWYVCGACGKVAVDTYDKFCRNCGTPIDWQEGR